MKVVDVTVVLPNYNHAHYLPDCLDAMLSQSCLPREILMIDDASTDHSVAVIKEYQKKSPRIKLIENKINQGPVIALSRGAELAEGKYLAFCSADDQVLPGFFEEGSRYLDLHPDVGICCSDPSFFKDQKPYRFIRKKMGKHQEPTRLPPKTLQNLILFSPLWLASHASLFRKESVLRRSNFDLNLHHISDWYLNLKIAFNEGIVYVPSSFGAFRLCRESYGATLNRDLKKKIRIYTELFSLLSREKEEFRNAFRKSGSLGNLSSDVLLFLFLRPALWSYLPNAFFRKFSNFIRKSIDWLVNGP